MIGYTEAPVIDLPADRPGPLPRAAVEQFDTDGYTVVRSVLPRAEAVDLGEEFLRLAQSGPVPGFFEPDGDLNDESLDPLRRYPRIMHPHRFHERSYGYLLDQRITGIIAQLLGEEPLACQTMLYFKPPGARGQALHQDNFYLKVEPGTCIAAWLALDEVGRDNGGLEVVPGTHRMPIFCPEEADSSVSFTRERVEVPDGLAPVPVDLAPGDMLFFNGSVVHGSGPNRTSDRFRRSFISHYAGVSAERMNLGYPTIRLTGEPAGLAEAEGGGPCGTEFDDAVIYH